MVSGEKFKITVYEDGILKTDPVPNNLSSYYESSQYISHKDSTNGLMEKLYQLVKSYMISKKASWISNEKDKGKILDFGAGTGEFLKKMESFSWMVEGVEPNKNARKLGKQKGLDLKENLDEVEKYPFDVITLWHVLEHIPDFENKIQEFKSKLQDDGLLIIAVPNYNSYDANHYQEDWAAWDVPRHIWHFSRKGLKNKMADNGFHLVKEKPLKFDSYYVSLLSEKNKGKGNSFLNAVYRGFLSNIKATRTKEYSSVAYFFKKADNN